MNIPILTDILIIFGLAVVVLLLCHRLRIPTIVGFLFTGIVSGPYGLGLVKAVHEVEIFAEVGVVLLLFTIGIEFSLERLLQIRKSVLVGGSIQVLLTIGISFLLAVSFGLAAGEAVFIGFLVALSSTAIVLKLIQERAELDSPHGRTALGMLIFQDIAIVPMILLTPVLAGAGDTTGSAFLFLLAKGLGIVLIVVVLAKWVVARVLYEVAKTRNQDLFLLSIILMCLGIAWLTSKAGLSLALGAFLAGLVLSESEYSHHALGNILPFRDIFTTFFFVSIGMMLDFSILLRQPALLAALTLGVLLLKSVIASATTLMLGLPLRTAVLTGLAVSQIGEFSFILSRAGLENGLMLGDVYQMFLAVSILTMAATPFVLSGAPHLADVLVKLPWPKRLLSGFSPLPEQCDPELKNHLVIIGFGVNGRNLARAASVAGIPYVIVDMNPETVRREQNRGEPIIFGDATQEAVLHHTNIREAKTVVIAINDAPATRRITELVRRLNWKVHLIVRTRFLQEVKPLYELGADEVIPEEFETSVEIFTRVLTKYLIPREEIERLVAEIRADGYKMLRSLVLPAASLSDLSHHLHEIDLTAFRISAESPLSGKTLGQVDLRKRFGVTVVAIGRNSEILGNPGAETVIQPGDILFLLGAPENISRALNG